MRKVVLWTLVALTVVATLSAQAPAFEVASVKESPPGDTGPVLRGGPQGGGRWMAQNATLHVMIEYLYPEYSPFGRLNQPFGGPDWASRTRWHINAVGPADASGATLNRMARELLKTRFGLEFHTEQRPVDVYAMVLASRDGTLGRGVTPAAWDCAPYFAARTGGQKVPPIPPRPPGGRPSCAAATDETGGVMRVQAGGMTMEQIASFMSGFNMPDRRPIVDRTGLPATARYDVDLRFTMYRGLSTTADTPTGFPLIRDAMLEQLGLRTEPRSEPRPLLVIDRATLPSPD